MLDRPLLVTRLSDDSLFPDPIWINPHTNWQGQYDSGEITRSSGAGACRNVSSGVYDNPPAGGGGGSTYGETAGHTWPDSLTACITVDWPARYQWRSKPEHGCGSANPPDKRPERP